MGIGQRYKGADDTSDYLACTRICVQCVSYELTFAGLQALEPRVINFCVAGAPTILVPSTTGSATTEFPGFL